MVYGRSIMTNWNLCLICQRSINEVLRSRTDGLITLATKIRKFNEHGRLKFDYSQIANENENLSSILKANNAKYNNTCQLRYGESKLKRFQLSNEKQLVKASQKESESEVLQKRSRRSAEEPGSSHVNKFQCYWCTQCADEANLRAAGQRWAKTNNNSEHKKTITCKWEKMAAVIKQKHILRSLSHCDVSGNELFYHTPCLTKCTNQYKSLFSTNNIDSTNDT